MRHPHFRRGEPCTRRVRGEDTPLASRDVARVRVRGERGVVLLLALVALLLIAAIGAAIIFLATSETAIVGAQKVGTRSYYAGLGGIEEARFRMMPGVPTDRGGLNNIDFTNPANTAPPYTPGFARLPAIPAPIGTGFLPGQTNPPTDILYIVNVANPSPGSNSDVTGSEPPLAEDPSRDDEVPSVSPATIRAVASIQPDAGDPNLSVQYRWIRINLKTELAAQQDLNLDGQLDEHPVFLFMGRHYRAGDLIRYQHQPGIGPGLLAGDTLPPPWGCDPLAPLSTRADGTFCSHTAPIQTRPCLALVCATPVYMLTALAETPLPPLEPASRLIRAEVSIPAGFSLNAGIHSEPAINVTGLFEASGRDICDPNCATNLDASAYDFPPFANNFVPGPQTEPMALNCRNVIPMQTEADNTTQPQPANASARSDPHCSPLLNPDCICRTGNIGGMPETQSCVLAGQPPVFNMDELINSLIPVARRLQEPVNDYYPQTGGGNVTCDATECTGTNLELGGFPISSYETPGPTNGDGADPIVTYVDRDLRCTAQCTGAGILIVDGDLKVNASMAFYGVVLVRGNLEVLGGGAPPTSGCNFFGSIVTADGVNTALGGSMCFQYNTCAQRYANSSSPAQGLSFREMPR